jgi:hypothetical protein
MSSKRPRAENKRLQETELAFGQTYARAAGVEHNIVNPNSAEFVFVEIELK